MAWKKKKSLNLFHGKTHPAFLSRLIPSNKNKRCSSIVLKKKRVCVCLINSNEITNEIRSSVYGTHSSKNKIESLQRKSSLAKQLSTHILEILTFVLFTTTSPRLLEPWDRQEIHFFLVPRYIFIDA